MTYLHVHTKVDIGPSSQSLIVQRLNVCFSPLDCINFLMTVVLQSVSAGSSVLQSKMSYISAHQLLTAPTVSLASSEEQWMFWEEGQCLMVLIYSLCDGEGRVSPGIALSWVWLSLRISWLVTSCCIRRNAFFSSFHVLFKMLSYSESAANSLNVICLSIAPAPPFFLGLFLPLCLQLCLII